MTVTGIRTAPTNERAIRPKLTACMAEGWDCDPFEFLQKCVCNQSSEQK
jgi:hypothetical protein